MAAKKDHKDNLPLSLNPDDSTGTITYANEVIAVISGVAANEVEGIAGMCTSGGISDVFGRNKNITKGVKVEIGSEEASVDLFVIVEYGTPIQTAALNVQEGVRKAIETMTGLHVVRVDVHVQGVSFEKETKDTLAGLESASMPEKLVEKHAEQPLEWSAEGLKEQAKEEKKTKSAKISKASPEPKPAVFVDQSQPEMSGQEDASAKTETSDNEPQDK